VALQKMQGNNPLHIQTKKKHLHVSKLQQTTANIQTKIGVKQEVEMMETTRMNLMKIQKENQMIKMSLKMKTMKKRKPKIIQNRMMKKLNSMFWEKQAK
jgi:hypothetical protein